MSNTTATNMWAPVEPARDAEAFHSDRRPTAVTFRLVAADGTSTWTTLTVEQATTLAAELTHAVTRVPS